MKTLLLTLTTALLFATTAAAQMPVPRKIEGVLVTKQASVGGEIFGHLRTPRGDIEIIPQRKPNNATLLRNFDGVRSRLAGDWVLHETPERGVRAVFRVWELRTYGLPPNTVIVYPKR